MRASMTDQCVRLGMAIVVIALISLALYQFSGRANAIEPGAVFTGNCSMGGGVVKEMDPVRLGTESAPSPESKQAAR